MNTPKEITIQRAWLEGLLGHSERVKNTHDEFQKRMQLASLLGYIESANYILKKDV